jgi:hypothetical protein
MPAIISRSRFCPAISHAKKEAARLREQRAAKFRDPYSDYDTLRVA